MIEKFFILLLPYTSHSYFMIFTILLACGLGLPIPEDITLVIGGILSSYDITTFWHTVWVCMLGVLGGDTITFLMGRFLGDRILKSKFLSRLIKKKHLDNVKLASDKYGNYLIFFARFMPGLRAPIYFSMGMFKQNFLTFITIDGCAAIISVPVWIYVGTIFGDNLSLLEHYIKNMQTGIYVAVGIIILIILLIHVLKKKFFTWFLK